MNSIERFSKQDVEDIVVMVRLELYNRGLIVAYNAFLKGAFDSRPSKRAGPV